MSNNSPEKGKKLGSFCKKYKSPWQMESFVVVYRKLNRPDRGAGFISTQLQGQAAAAGEREHRRSAENAWIFQAGSSENICRIVTNPCGALSEQYGAIIFIAFTVGSLSRAIRFFSLGNLFRCAYRRNSESAFAILHSPTLEIHEVCLRVPLFVLQKHLLLSVW